MLYHPWAYTSWRQEANAVKAQSGATAATIVTGTRPPAKDDVKPPSDCSSLTLPTVIPHVYDKLSVRKISFSGTFNVLPEAV